MTRCRPLFAGLSLCLMLLAGRAQGEESDDRATSSEIELLREEIERLKRLALPPVLLDRPGIEAVFGTDSSEYTSRRDRKRKVTRYRLRVNAALDVWYVDGYAAGVRLRIPGSVGGQPFPVQPEVVHATLKRRRETYLALLTAYRDELPPGGMDLSERICQELLAYLADRPTSLLCEAIMAHLPAERDAALLPVLITYRGTDRDQWISRRMRASAHRRPALLGVLITALASDAVDEARKEIITEVLLVVSGYGGRALDSPWFWDVWHRHRRAAEDDVRQERAKWWQEWWNRHRDSTRVARLMEPLATEKFRSNACVALGNLDDPRVPPILVRLLDDDERTTRLYAASALLRRKYEGRRYERINHPTLAGDEVAVLAEAREWARSQGIQAGEAAERGASADADNSPR